MHPQPFGRYQLLDRVASGGMAEVWRARLVGEGGFQRIIAIKKILPNVSEDVDFITMFHDEANITVQMQHSNIAQVYEFNRIDDVYYIAMEYVSGKDLKTAWQFERARKLVLPIELSCFIVSRVADGLDYAHRKKDNTGNDVGVVHRDVSPQNVLLSWDGEVKVIDFGIAKAKSKSGRTQPGTLKGKFAYMAPEQIKGLPLDGRADVFSIGVILYELLTGERAFQADAEFSLLEMVRNVEIRAPRSLNKDIPPSLEKILFKALAKDRDQRYRYASDLSEDLARFLLERGRPPSRHDLAAYLKDRFTPDYDRERQRLETYRELPAEPTHPSTPRSRSQTSSGERPPSLEAVREALAEDTNESTGPFASGSGPHTSPGSRGSSGPSPTSFVMGPGQVADEDLYGNRTPTHPPQMQADNTALVARSQAPQRMSPLKAVAIGASLAVVVIGVGLGVYGVTRVGNSALVVTIDGAPQANVSVDGRVVGVAAPSLAVERIDSGSHMVIVQADGYIAFSKQIDVQPNVLFNLRAPLARLNGKLSVTTSPAGATLLLGDKTSGPVTPTVVEVESEIFHRVTLHLDGYKDEVLPGVKVKPGAELPVDVTLRPERVRVRISSTPSPAFVRSAGKVVGTTPYVLELGLNDEPPALDLVRRGCQTARVELDVDRSLPEHKSDVTLKCSKPSSP